MMKDMFNFKRFSIRQDRCAMKVGTDGVLLGAWGRGGRRILDVGCGTGIIALIMAQRFPDALVTAIDIDADCCLQTRQNADLTEWGSRVEVANLSVQEFATRTERFDAIVSNPPFFVDSLKNADSKRTLARHTDSLPFGELLEAASRLLTQDGRLSVILPEEHFKEFETEACFAGFYLAEDVAIRTTHKKPVRRHLAAFVRQRPSEIVRTEESLQDAEGRRSEWYEKLTEDFYLQ